MSMKDSLKFNCIKIGSTAKTKDEILKEIVKIAKKDPILDKLNDIEIYKALKTREELGSTGFNKGMAIPHCSFDSLKDFVVGVLSIPEGVDFDSIDGEKTNLIFFIIGPTDNRNKHIRILSSISKIAKTPGVLENICNAADETSLRTRILENLSEKEEVVGNVSKCQFTIFIQNEDTFEDVLEILSSELDGSISVLETSNASYYLNKLPLFAAYWTENHHSFSRVIIAIVNKTSMNETIRKINMLSDVEKEPGLLITVQDLLYTSGSIEF